MALNSLNHVLGPVTTVEIVLSVFGEAFEEFSQLRLPESLASFVDFLCFGVRENMLTYQQR